MESLSKFGKGVLLIGLALWVTIVALIVIYEIRFPGTDVFLFKEAAVNFALKSKLVASNLVYMPLDKEMPFAHYPPVYPTVFGLWMKVFGIGLKQSLLFECIVRGLRSLLLAALIWPFLKNALNERKIRIWGFFTVLFFLLLSIVSTDDDRPDELGLVIGLSSWWVLMRAKHLYQYILSGLLLGLTAATSPACSVAIGFGTLSYFFFRVKQLRPFVFLSLGAGLTFAASVLPILVAHGEVVKRFSSSANASSLPYPLPWQKGVTWERFLSRVEYCMNHYFALGFKLTFCFLAVLSIAILMREKSRFKIHPFQISAVVFALIAPPVWSLQPYYLWFSVLPLSVFFIASLLKQNQPNRIFGFLGLLVAFFPLFFHESKMFVTVAHQPREEKSEFVREKLLQHIRPGERIAISPDQFFTLRKYREVANINFVCHSLSKFDYVYVTRMWSAKQGHPTAVDIPCWAVNQVKCFEPIENLSLNYPLILGGLNTGYVTRGNGGTLYKNTKCTEKVPKQVASGFPVHF